MPFIGYTYIMLKSIGQRAKLAEHMNGELVTLNLDYEPRGMPPVRAHRSMLLNDWRRSSKRRLVIEEMKKEIEQKYVG